MPCTVNPCQNGGTCFSKENGETLCKCAEGYEGTNCNETVEEPCDVVVCENGGTCVETGTDADDYRCNCAHGWGGENCNGA